MSAWSHEQQRLLQAMGYVLYVPAPAALPAPSSGDRSAPMPEAGRLLRALQHAANGREISGLIADLAVLRGNAAGKRALWPKLRALRRPR